MRREDKIYCTVPVPLYAYLVSVQVVESVLGHKIFVLLCMYNYVYIYINYVYIYIYVMYMYYNNL